MADASEQLIQLITMIRPMASTDVGRDAINKTIFAEHKVAEETVKVMATLGLIDADALANALASMVPAQPTVPAPPVSNQNGLVVAHPLIPQPGFNNMPAPAAAAPFVPPPSTLGYDSRMAYGAPDSSWNAPPQPPPPPAARPPPAQVEVPAFAQHLPPDQRSMVLAAIGMSQAEVDMLPPTQRAIFMELRSVAGI